MRIFISWSGSEAHQIAEALREWLPDVLQAVRPWVSSEDIDKGERWSPRIAQELDETSQGLVVVTASNVDAPWLNFEAGALAKSVDDARVRTFLWNLAPTDVTGPLSEFQATTAHDKNDVFKLIKSINEGLERPLTDDKLAGAFDRTWPELEERLREIETDESEESVERTKRELLEEVLVRVRSIERAQERSTSLSVKPYETRVRAYDPLQGVTLVDDEGRELRISTQSDLGFKTSASDWLGEQSTVVGEVDEQDEDPPEES